MLKKTHSDKQIASLIESLTSSPNITELAPQDQALIDYALKLTCTPAMINSDDIEILKAQGFDDLAIHDLVCCVSYFAFVNRIADGLGVNLESDG